MLQLALEEAGPETQRALKHELLAAYFTRAENVADHAVLQTLAEKVGLDPERVAAVLAGDEYAAEVERDTRDAAAMGANGVPFFVLDRRFGDLGCPAGRGVHPGARADAGDRGLGRLGIHG